MGGRWLEQEKRSLGIWFNCKGYLAGNGWKPEKLVLVYRKEITLNGEPTFFVCFWDAALFQILLEILQ